MTPSTATAWLQGTASVTWATPGLAAGTASPCLAVSTATAPRASSVSVSRAGRGCSVTSPSVRRAVSSVTGCVLPRGSASVVRDTQETPALTAPPDQAVSTETVRLLWTVTVTRAGPDLSVTLLSVLITAARSTAPAPSRGSVSVSSATKETPATPASPTRAVSTGTVTTRTTATAGPAGLGTSVMSRRLTSTDLA